jgi:hypothetical protein
MAKNQNLALIPSKINGVCGQLKCCIKYEDDVYAAKRKLLPRENSFIQAANGDRGKVTKLHILAERFDMITDRGQIRRYALTQFDRDIQLPKDWNFPEHFDSIINETSQIIGLQEKVPLPEYEFYEDDNADEYDEIDMDSDDEDQSVDSDNKTTPSTKELKKDERENLESRDGNQGPRDRDENKVDGERERGRRGDRKRHHSKRRNDNRNRKPRNRQRQDNRDGEGRDQSSGTSKQQDTSGENKSRNQRRRPRRNDRNRNKGQRSDHKKSE